MTLRRDLSTFLDLTRLTAAVIVFLGHLSSARFGGQALAIFAPLAHSVVVTFFVLSGYVIVWAAQRDGDAAVYAVNRAARIYSVVLPALALTFVIDTALGVTSYQHTHCGSISRCF